MRHPIIRNALDVVNLMNEGYKLGRDSGTVWLQKPDLGCGGDARSVHSQTFFGMLKREVIRPAKRQRGDAYNLHRFELTGRTAF